MGTKWSVKKPDNGVQCSLCKAPNIYIEPIPADKIRLLMEEYSHTEWIGYLVGEENKDSGDIFVEDIVIPPHEETNGASCLAEPFHIPKKGCVGVIHSHHTMGAFHSGQDDHTVDRNFSISITVAKKSANLEYDAISHVTTPCGKHSLLRCSVKYIQPKPLFDRKEWLEKAKENIDKGLRPKEIKGADNYIPVRYRFKEDGVSYVVDNTGKVLSSKEYQDIMKGIWQD